VSAAQDSLRLTCDAVVEAAALDGDRTAVDAQVRERPGLGAWAWIDMTIGSWYADAGWHGLTTDAAVHGCLRALDAKLAAREHSRPDPTTVRVRAALTAALSEVQS